MKSPSLVKCFEKLHIKKCIMVKGPVCRISKKSRISQNFESSNVSPVTMNHFVFVSDGGHRRNNSERHERRREMFWCH